MTIASGSTFCTCLADLWAVVIGPVVPTGVDDGEDVRGTATGFLAPLRDLAERLAGGDFSDTSDAESLAIEGDVAPDVACTRALTQASSAAQVATCER